MEESGSCRRPPPFSSLPAGRQARSAAAGESGGPPGNATRPFYYLLIFFFASVLPAMAFEDIRYDITARFDPREKTVEAREMIVFTNDTGRDLLEITLRVYPHHRVSSKEKRNLYKYAGYFKADPYPDGFDAGRFLVRSVRIGEDAGTEASFAYEGQDETLLKVVLPQPLKDGASLSLTVDFSLKIPHKAGRYGWHRRTFALNRWYPLLNVFDKKDSWLNHPDYLLHMPYVSEAARYRLRLELPQEYVVASGCDEVQVTEGPGGLKIVELSNSSPLRELTLAISRDYEIFEKTQDGVTVKSYHFKKDKESARRAAEAAFDFIRFTSRIAPYPSRHFSIAPVYLGYGGSQNAGIIFLDARAYQIPSFLARYFEFLVAHETGHQWWYHVVGNDEYKELWLDEGLNSYWLMRYLEDKYGPDAKLASMPDWVEFFIPNPRFKDIRDWRYLTFARRGLDQPVLTDIESFYEPSLIFTVAYGKGSVVLEMLSERLGEEKFLGLMRRYHERFRFRIARVEDFIRMASESVGEDLAPFFKKWLMTAQLYDHALRRRAKDRLILERREDMAMPVEVRAHFQDGATEIFSSDGEKKMEEIVWRGAGKVATADAQGSGFALDIDRVNNFIPRRVETRFVPVYHGLYDMSLFLPRDAYVWTTGPSFSGSGVGVRTSFQKPDDYIVTAGFGYDFGAESLNSSVGFEKKQLMGRYMSWGVELLNRDARTLEESDLRSYKLYLRQELDFPSTVFEASSHATLYLLHNQPFGRAAFLGPKEEARSLRYRQNKETIFGATLFYSNAGALPDPCLGHKLIFNPEVAGHILGGREDFARASLEWDKYIELGRLGRAAWRLKAGLGHPKDKELFYLGSDRELRGYDFKTITGSSALLGSAEYRFPLLRDIDSRLFWRMLTLDQIQGVVFFDAGSAWSARFNEPGFKKDVGVGLRFYFNVAGAAERFAVRVDAAHPLDGQERDTHIWLGINHAF